MLRSQSYQVIVLLVIVFGVWITFTQHQHSRFVAVISEVELGDPNSNLIQKDKQAEQLQEFLNHALESDNSILKKFEELQLENEKLRGHLVRHIADTALWRPLRDLTKFSVRSFISDIISREHVEGPPEIFEFPSTVFDGRHLCFRGNDSHNGTQNSYTFAWEEALPSGYILLNGTTLISETEYDYVNPWHSHYNLLQFVWWKLNNGCEKADRFLIYHKSELRNATRIGNWITQILTATGLPTQPYDIAIGDRPICFQRALVSRLGIGRVPTEMMQELYAQVRCQVRAFCNLPTTRTPENGKQSINVTLMVRSGTRRWKDPKAWERVIDDQCSKVEGCRRTNMYIANMTFCEQVKSMMETDILMSVHGAQLTNMMFMSPGGRVLEMFPKGWERAGIGQYLYRSQAKWNGLVHEGYWRDNDLPDCPTPDDKSKCLTYIKGQDVGIKETYISSWFGGVLKDFKSVKLSGGASSSGADSHGDHTVCSCMANGSI